MLRFAVLVVLFTTLVGIHAQTCEDKSKQSCPESIPDKLSDKDPNWLSSATLYDFHARDIHGNNVSLDKYRGHVVLIVNVASKCGLTDSNYKQLVELYDKYKDKEGLRILAFPSNQFGGQEPGTSQEILDFVKDYNVTFDIFEKVDVNGENALPLWKWLQSQASGFMTDAIKWNFTKFIVNKEGKVVSRFAPTTAPMDIESELKKYF